MSEQTVGGLYVNQDYVAIIDAPKNRHYRFPLSFRLRLEKGLLHGNLRWSKCDISPNDTWWKSARRIA